MIGLEVFEALGCGVEDAGRFPAFFLYVSSDGLLAYHYSVHGVVIMRPEDWQFSFGWWGTDLGDLVSEARPRVGTYGRYDFTQLPSLPFKLNGDFRWLANSPFQESSIGSDPNEFSNITSFGELEKFCADNKINLPESFVRFMRSPDLANRIRSSTDCYISICPEVVPAPFGDGYLIRFLSDSQACVFWYIFLTAGCTDHAVVSSTDFYGNEDEAEEYGAEYEEEEEKDAQNLVFNAGSFEEFMCRFWLENEIWFADYEGSEMPACGREYIERYTAKA